MSCSGLIQLFCPTHKVVATTCNGAGSTIMEDERFKMLIIDEANQATEPATFVPLSLGVECLVMVGDPKQLPPTVLSKEASKLGLGVPLFERLRSRGVRVQG